MVACPFDHGQSPDHGLCRTLAKNYVEGVGEVRSTRVVHRAATAPPRDLQSLFLVHRVVQMAARTVLLSEVLAAHRRGIWDHEACPVGERELRLHWSVGQSR